jgi:hypothetical protein
MKSVINGSWVALAVALAACAGASSDPPPPPDGPGSEPAHAPAPAEPAESAESPAASAQPESTAHPGAAPAPDAPEGSSLRARIMNAHFKETVTIRTAIINGQLHKAGKPARKLAEMKGVETLPKQWQLATKRLTKASQRISESSDLQESAAATADIGRACGACHVAVSGPKPKYGDAPEAGSTVKEHMQLHQWATERLWEGLYVPSDKAWKDGVAALENDVFPQKELKGADVHARSSASRFGQLVKKAKAAKSGDQRAQVYASMLTTCAPCHSKMID